MPASLTRTHAVSGVAPAACTVICGWPSEYLTALSRRLVTAVRKSSTSPLTTSGVWRSDSTTAIAFFGEVMPRARGVDAFLDEPRRDRPARDVRARCFCRADAGAQHLLDGVLQAIGILQHDAIELLALRVADLARLQRLEVQADRRDRRLQLVRDRVEEAVLLFGDAHFADQEHRVDDEARDDQGEGDDAEHERRDAPPVHQDPADVEGNGCGDENDAEDDEDDRGGLAPCHVRIRSR